MFSFFCFSGWMMWHFEIDGFVADVRKSLGGYGVAMMLFDGCEVTYLNRV